MISILDLKISNLEKSLGLDRQHSLLLEQEGVCNEHVGTLHADATLFIGDNLPYLKMMAMNSPALVDLCYIDPPYNTGSKFLYHDSRKSDASGPFGTHTAWMSFMLPRLVAAREILKDSGIITISIDDYEFSYLKVLMDHIFGEENFIGNVIVCRSKNGKGSKKNLASNHEYLLIYGKSDKAMLRGQADETTYNKEDKYGKYRVDGLFRKKGEASLKSDRPNMHYPVYFNPSSGEVSVDPIDGWKIVFPVDSKGIERRWLWGIETARERAWQLYASKNGVIYVKNYSGNGIEEKRTKVRSLWSETSFYTERGTNEINNLFGAKVFDTPKPQNYIKKIIDICSPDDAFILDFFAGSGTTAHAAAELNNDDKGTRKCILMESDDKIPAKHLAKKMGFSMISEITKKRLQLIKEEYPNFRFKVIENKSDVKELSAICE
ncbi:site-specific DNA-methyltransferase [Vibrio parahaemolyticus]|uniref:site-specific DNA-methyltransferase n=1 Tax=Vibrio harveyi group TaxID=717610 RepID=UPI00038E6488|nr:MULTISPECIES: site-specific DNA-methyltransferase [Vibrio harveyi group]RFD41157.1 modification methylase [Vibrio parahaemolyticus 3355]HDY7752870.1 site-specific DNA-methyltransferase [Vibrio vulnificus]EGR0983850.1 site-specific DNA-methyltransferase [Vibrio parahaemolyticus]EGR1371809.1 site-specific DNA-methyltransferase [Vibrio parahaemolyticus]EGR2858813.1 site-specific DNA-methyltransferase [Vibrio parahaemolyticus]